jgi:hypothetical protein
MQPQYRDDNLPEVHRPDQSHKYSVPEYLPLYLASSPKGYHQSLVNVQSSSTTQRGRTRWWTLPLAGLLIALVAGLVGGFVGQAIQKGHGSSSAPSAALPSPAPSNSSSSAITPPPNYSPRTIGTIVIPQTGCNFPESKERRRLSNATLYNQDKYTTVCNSGWMGYGLIGLWTLTPSECIEACIQYNTYAQDQRRPSSERSCVGGGFIPAWTNQTLGVQMGNGSPFNCYLKSNATSIGINDRANTGVEVVALCLNGKCNGAGIS